MDQRKAKRPRGSKDLNNIAAPPKKKSKTKKTRRKSTDADMGIQPKAGGPGGSSTHPSSSLETTATKEGQIMAQMLSTFSHLEQSRFRAFRRSALDTSVVSEWLAASLQSHYPNYRSTFGPTSQTGSNDPNDNNNDIDGQRTAFTNKHSTLQDWTAPGQADPIANTAAILAKIYAQRMVHTAIELRQQAANSATANNDERNSDNAAYTVDTTGPLSAEWIKMAWEARTSQGLDPGFFLQSPSEQGDVLMRHPPSSSSAFETRRLAALAAQDAYNSAKEKEKSDRDAMDVSPTND